MTITQNYVQQNEMVFICSCIVDFSEILLLLLLLLLLFLFSFTSLSSFFNHFETNQSVGGAKTGVPGEKPPDTPASRT